MPDTTDADVLVVGAGILGTSLAHHLLLRGAGRVVVVEAETPSAATSGAGAGFVGLWAAGYANFLTDTDLELEQYGIDFYRRLAERTPDIECRTNGNLYLATTESGWTQWVEPVLGHPLAPKGTRQLTPHDIGTVTGGVVAPGSVVGGALHPGGIQISAGRATRALAASVRELGGEIRERTRVTGLIVSDGAVIGALTDTGLIRARRVVLACGAWSNELLRPLGHRLPLLRMVATRVVSPPSGVPDTMPTVMVPDLYGLWLRAHRSGLTWGNGDGYSPSYELDDAVGTESRPHYPELVDRLRERLLPGLRTLVPEHDLSIDRWLQGIPCMTPDRSFLAGAVPGVPGLYVLGGDNEAGVTHGPGLGRLMAEEIDTGGSDWLDASPYRLDRFEADRFPTERDVADAMPARR
ncbi:FAD-binding oxidoreductase [Streptomyces sp. NBC_00878]|uniref:NAD(P)/FAD-dependent oxidoreductase n=1 Tax=Streptomyces sp. NBC_00878 TaxID=2975854 RepID=UPI00224F90AC|nr:FAD-binding oxidoreductase [Streptomyces sp. NBC_00878]MCX4911682.1 FAD-binding oxidoreductase [Streptomyces sp. NBC_00878]